MGRRGPGPKPTALRVLQGNPAKRPLPRNEAKPKPLAPECPDWLAPLAREEWERLANELERVGLLTAVDGTAFAGYCQNYAIMREAQAVLDREGLTYLVVRGAYGSQTMARPEVAIVQRCWDQMRRFMIEFGLTPSARARLGNLPTQGEDDTLSGLLQ